MARLPDPDRSYAVLIGASSYHAAKLPNLPAVVNNLSSLAAVLTDPELGSFTQERCITVTEASSVRDTYLTLRRYAAQAEDTFLMYLAGHGLTGAKHHELFLAVKDTDPDELRVSALDYDLIRDVFRECPATNRVIILDCCFSGRAAEDFMSSSAESILGQVAVEGTYTLTSTSANKTASAPVGATYTAFTGELLELLKGGLPDGPELLSLNDIYRRLRYTMKLRGLPLPVQRGTNTTAELLALVRNTTHRPAPALKAPSTDLAGDSLRQAAPTTPQQLVPPTATPDAIIGADTDSLVPRRRRLRWQVASVIIGIVVVIASVVGVILANRDSGANQVDSGQHGSVQNTSPRTTSPPQTTSLQTTTTEPASTTSFPPLSANFQSIPVRVYNNSKIVNLAARAGQDFRNGGWNVVSSGNYSQGIIPTSTVYFQPGTAEEPAARELALRFGLQATARFPGLNGEPSGLIVIVQNDYGSK